MNGKNMLQLQVCWHFFIGLLNFSGEIITLLLRLPDGTKEHVALPSNTCLKVGD